MEPLTTVVQVVAWSGLILFIFVILGLYYLINGKTYSNPIILLITGFIFLSFALLIKTYYAIQFSDDLWPFWTYISDIIEVSCAALGGSLFSVAFIIKMQIKHNAGIISLAEELEEKLETKNEQIEIKSAIVQNKNKYSLSEYTDKLDSIREKLRKTEKEIRKLENKLTIRKLI
jgi:hypothetical protein